MNWKDSSSPLFCTVHLVISLLSVLFCSALCFNLSSIVHRPSSVVRRLVCRLRKLVAEGLIWDPPGNYQKSRFASASNITALSPLDTSKQKHNSATTTTTSPFPPHALATRLLGLPLSVRQTTLLFALLFLLSYSLMVYVMDDFHPSLVRAGLYENPEDRAKRWSSFIGIVTALCGNILISFALNIQKYAHVRLARERDRQRAAQDKRANRKPNYGATVVEGMEGHMQSSFMSTVTERTEGSDEDGGMNGHSRESSTSKMIDSPTTPSKWYQEQPREEEEEATTPPYLRSGWWWTGIVLMTLGECGNFLAYGFAPASIVSPLGVVALISNCIIAPVVLKEPFRGRDFIGVLVAIVGVVVVILSSSPEEVKLGPHEILDAISQTAFEVYFGISCALMVFLAYISGTHGDRFIVIDLGLVALFGMYIPISKTTFANMTRWIHCAFNQRCFVVIIIYALQNLYISDILPAGFHSCFDCHHANQVSEPITSTVRLDSGHSHSVCALYTVRHHWICDFV